MLTRPRNGEHVEQLEIIEAQHVHQPRGASLILGEVEPAVELPLRLADGRLDARNTVLDQGNVTAFGHEGDLVLEVRSEEHTSELQSLMRTSYAVFCLKK